MGFTAEQTALWSVLSSALVALSTLYFAFSKNRRDAWGHRAAQFEIKQKYFDNFRRWAESLANLLSEAAHLCNLDPARTTGESFLIVNIEFSLNSRR